MRSVLRFINVSQQSLAYGIQALSFQQTEDEQSFQEPTDHLGSSPNITARPEYAQTIQTNFGNTALD
jgi:hypothetical protein